MQPFLSPRRATPAKKLLTSDVAIYAPKRRSPVSIAYGAGNTRGLNFREVSSFVTIEMRASFDEASAAALTFTRVSRR